MKKPKRLLPVFLCAAALFLSSCSCRLDIHTGRNGASGNKADADGRRVIVDKKKDFYSDYRLGAYTEIRLKDGASRVVSGDAEGVEITEDRILIRKDGTYVLNGRLSDGMIIVDADKESDVRLVLDHVDVCCKNAAPLYVVCADKCILSLSPGTVNTFTDEKTGTMNGESLTGAVYSKEDLVINGGGTLIVHAKANDGIVSKDTLKIMEGSLEIHARDDALYGKDELIIRNGYIRAEGGSQESNEKDSGWFGSGGSSQSAGASGTAEDPDRGAGLKAKDYIGIDGGEIIVTSGEDGLHSEGAIYISGGQIEVTAEDDGVHADGQLYLLGGALTVMDSEEGCEAERIVIRGGTHLVRAMDDGLNAAAQTEGRNVSITVSGGEIVLDAVGDALDSNGDLELSGGTLLINGPGDEDCLVLDVQDGNELKVKGASILCIGDPGLPDEDVAGYHQRWIRFRTEDGEQGDQIRIADPEGRILLSMTAAREYRELTATCPEFQEEESYSIEINGNIKGRMKVPKVILSGE